MEDEIEIEGVKYISSKRASGLSGYAQDYIGQLARKGLIDAQRVGGLWYVSFSSLTSYKAKADTYKPQPPQRVRVSDPDSLIAFDGKDHVSAARAAEITGYHQDYVGQLARSGTVMSRQVGNRWYVEREGILAHKQQKDGLLAAVQSQAVGLVRPSHVPEETASGSDYVGSGSYLTYTRDDGDLMPVLRERDMNIDVREKTNAEKWETSDPAPVPIRIIHRPPSRAHMSSETVKSRKTLIYGTLAASALTIVIVLSFGFPMLRSSSIYTSSKGVTGNALTASATVGLAKLSRIGDFLEKLLVPELVYRRVE